MISGIITAILMLCFLAGTAWVWSSKRKPEFDAAANIPLEENTEDTP